MSAFLERTTGFEPATPTLTFPIALPRWGSRVRIPSSAPKKRTSTCAFTSNAVSTLSPLPMSCPWLAHDGPTVPGHGTRFDAERGPSVARGGPGHGIGRQAHRGPGRGPGRSGRDRMVAGGRAGGPCRLRGGPGHRAGAWRLGPHRGGPV